MARPRVPDIKPGVQGRGEKGIIKDSGVLGCKSKSDVGRFISILRANDEEALRKLAAIHLMRRDCLVFTEGDEFIVEDPGVWSDNLCARPKGEIDCYWTNKGWVRKQ